MNNYEQALFDLFGRVTRYIRTQPLNLGGYTTISGGGGGPPGGFTGYLPQGRVAFDETEASSLDIPISGSSIINNLNRIRYRLAQLESVSGIGDISIADFWENKGDLAVGLGVSSATILPSGNNGEFLSVDNTTLTGLKWTTISGVTASGGDVNGPSSAADGNFVSFDGITGKLLKDSGYDETSFSLTGHTHVQLHDAVTILDTATIDLNLSGQQISATVLPDGIKLDDLGTPDDNTDLDVSISKHGLFPRLPNDSTKFLNGVGEWVVVSGTTVSGSGTGDVEGPSSAVDDNIATFDGTTGKLIQDGGVKITDLVRTTVLTNMKEPTGFIDRTSSSLSWSDGSRELSIVPSGVSYGFYSGGSLYTKTITDTKQITTISGLHYVYFDTTGTIQSSTTSWDINSANIPIASIYWNGTNGLLMDERHGIQMDGMTHEYLHETRGSAFAYGMAGTFAANGSSITIGSGEWYDDDIEYTTPEYTQCRIFYLDGSIWKWSSAQNAYYHTVSSVPQYNSSGALADVGVSKYSVSWVYMSNFVATPIIVIMGQAEYNTQALAEAASVPSLGSLPATEMILLYKVIWQRNGSVITWKRTDDYRRTSGGPVSNYIATDHGSLAGLTDNDHPQYILAPSSPEQGDILYYDGNNCVSLPHGTSKQYLKSGGHGANPSWSDITTSGSGSSKLEIYANGNGSVPSTGYLTEFTVPCNMTITGWDIVANAAGSIVFDLWKDTYANYPPTVIDTVTGTDKPTLSSQQKNISTALTGWTTTWSDGDKIFVNIDSIATITRALLTISYNRS